MATLPACGKKRLFVFCDGTAQDGLISLEVAEDLTKALGSDPELGKLKEYLKKVQYASNVFRLSRCIKPLTSDNVHQVVMYQSGVGVPDNFEADNSHFRATVTGTAVAAKIRDAYNFIVQNYVPGDQIYLFGFSRGAFTARKVAGLLDTLGLLNKEQMSLLFTHWRDLNQRRRADEADPKKLGEDVKVEFLGVWDTVGSILENGIKELKDLLGIKDTSLPTCVKQARHALAYHEQRSYFRCTPFTVSEDDKRLAQVWFPGVHADVGGGYEEHQISDISLLWMAGELKDAGVELDEDYLDTRLSQATADGLEVHYESKPNLGNGSRRDIFQETMRYPSTYRHRSLWATLKHLDPSRQEYWNQPAQTLSLLPARAKELNDIEQRFWAQRWKNTIPPPMPRGRGPMRTRLPDADLNQVHPAPTEDEGFAALFE